MPRHRHVSGPARVRVTPGSSFVHVLCAAPVQTPRHSLCGEPVRRGRGELPLPGLPTLLCERCAGVLHAEGNRQLFERLEAAAQ